MEVLLDSSFIISCVRRKIDFLESLSTMGFVPVLPREVLQEMKDLRQRGGGARADRGAIDAALKMIESGKIKKTTLGNKKVDVGLIEKGKQGIYIATLDREVKRNVPNRIVISNARESLEIDRD